MEVRRASGWMTVVAVVLASTAGATPVLQRKALAAGFPATDCRYCHTFDTAHMQDRARQLGISTTNCVACHGARLPKAGPGLMNHRGMWLLSERKKRQNAPDVDVRWLKGYVTPSPGTERGKRP